MSAEVRAIVLQSSSILSSLVVEWCSGDRNQEIQWNTTSNADVIYHSVNVNSQTEFNEILEQATWGTLYYAMQTVGDTQSI
jgi:hypothetical protein